MIGGQNYNLGNFYFHANYVLHLTFLNALGYVEFFWIVVLKY
jgi:hypothetical protein